MSRPKNLLSSHYITAQKSFRVFFCLSSPIDLGTTYVLVVNLLFLNLRETVSHKYFPRYVYKWVMYMNFIFISPMHGVTS
jgi:hypothetical protein